MGKKMERVCEKHYSRVISCRGIRKNGIGERASEYWEWGLGEKYWLRFTIKIGFSQMPHL